MRQLLFCTILSISLYACKQEDLTPSFLRIDEIELTTELTTQGDNSHGIVDAWVYLDNTPIGVFETPCVIPILEEGEHQLVIYPGIKNNGVSGSRIRYPFYERWEATVNLTKNDTLHVFPTVTYKSNVKMELLEDFEDAGIEFVPAGISDTSIQFVTDPSIVKYGDKCGGIFLTSEDTIFHVESINNLVLNRNESCFVEFDFRNDNTLAIGVIARNSSAEVDLPIKVIVNPQVAGSEVWKKIYIDIEDEVSSQVNATSYGIYFISSLDAENTSANVYIDNIKVVRYQ